MARKSPTLAVVRRLFAFSGNTCAFPECTARLIDSDNDLMGEICHIEAAESLGQRYNKLQNDEQRRSYDNLILLCFNHHKKTDDVSQYTVEVLKSMKAAHELRFRDEPYQLPREAEEKIFEKLEQMHDDILENLRLTRHGNDRIEQILSNTEALLVSANGPGKESRGNSVRIGIDESQLYSKQLEFIRRLRKDRKAVTALQELKRLEEENWEEFDEELRYKIIANIAVTLFDLGRTSEAGQYLLKLEQIEFRSMDYLGFLALGYAITENKSKFDQLFDDPAVRQSENSNLWIAYVNIHKNVTAPTEIEEAIPKSVSVMPEILFALGEAFLDAGDEKAGFSKLDQALVALGTDIKERWHLQGVIASKKLLTIAGLNKIAFRAFDQAEKAQIQELVNLLTESWLYVAESEMAKPSWHLILNRGVAYRALQDPAGAEKDFEAAWSLTGNFASYKNLILQYIDTGQLKKAEELIHLSTVEQIPGFSSVDFVMLSARLGLATGDQKAASDMLTAQLSKSTGDERKLILDLIVVGLFEIGAFQHALPFVEMLIEEFSDSPHGYLSMATFLRKTDRVKEAESYLQKAFETMKLKKGPEWVWFLLGEEYYQLRYYSKAVACLRNVYRPGIDNDVAHRLALANFYDGEYDEAENICRDIILVSKNSTLAHEILFRIYENSGRNEEASKILWQYLKNGKRNSLDHFRFLGIRFYHGINDLENLRRLLSEIDNPSSYKLHQQFVVAQMHIIYGQISKGLEIAFDARIEHFELAKAHELYVYLLLRGENESMEQMYPGSVEEMTAVEVLDKASKSSTYLITSDKRFTGPHILRSGDSLATLLIGKSIGDTVTIHNSIGAGNSLTISAIMSKYNYAFKESLKLLETKFAGQSQIFFFQTGSGESLDSMQEFLNHHASIRRSLKEQILRFYNSGAATIGAVSCYYGKDIIETWLELISDTSTGIICYDSDESANLDWAVLNERPVVLETTALLTLFALLGSEHLLEKLGVNFHVARATLDEIVAYRYKLEVLHSNAGSKKTNGQTSHEFAGPETQKDWCDRLIDWCTSKTTQQTPKATISVDNETTDLEDIIGKGAYHSLELSRQIGASLLSDDARLKSLASAEYGIKSFSCYQVLVKLLTDDVISTDQFEDFSKILVRNNYVYIPVTEVELWTLYEETVFELRPPFTHAVRGLVILKNQYAVSVVVSFAKSLYLNSIPAVNRDNTLQFILRTIKKRHDYDHLRRKMLLAVDDVFRYLPQYRDNFRDLILAI